MGISGLVLMFILTTPNILIEFFLIRKLGIWE